MTGWSMDWEHRVRIPNPKYNKNNPRSRKTLLETPECFEKRQYYQDLGSKRTKAAVAEHFNISDTRVREIAKKYGWDDIIIEMESYYAWVSHITLKEAQDTLLETIQSEVKEEIRVIRFAIMDLSVRLGFIPDPETKVKKPDKNLDYLKAITSYKNLVSSLKELRAMAYRAVGLADKLNAPQTIIQDGELELKQNHKHENHTQELLDYEDYFKQLDTTAKRLSETNSTNK